MAKKQATRKPRASGERLPVRAVQRAFELLAQLGGEESARTLSELSRGSALPVSTVSRLLATLEQAGFVRREDDARYAPGTRLLQLGLAALRQLSIYDLAQPHLRRLSEASGETANLAAPIDAKNAIYLRQVLSPRSIHHAAWLGRVLPLERTAVGHALSGKLNGSGYVARRNTLEPDVTAVAAPVTGPTGAVVAALSITGPSYRIADTDLAKFGTLVVREATGLSETLGAPAGRRGR